MIYETSIPNIFKAGMIVGFFVGIFLFAYMYALVSSIRKIIETDKKYQESLSDKELKKYLQYKRERMWGSWAK